MPPSKQKKQSTTRNNHANKNISTTTDYVMSSPWRLQDALPKVRMAEDAE